jgi:hypothetical protein
MINNIPYALPDPSQIDNAIFVQSQYLVGLLNNRDKLFKQIFSLPTSDKKLVESTNYLIMKN